MSYSEWWWWWWWWLLHGLAQHIKDRCERSVGAGTGCRKLMRHSTKLYRIFSNLIRTLFTVLEGWKNQMRITITCGLDSRSRAGFWKNDGAAVHAVRTIQYNNLLFYLLLIIIYYSTDTPSSLITESLSVLRRDCARLLRKTRFTVPVWLISPRRSVRF